MVRLVFRNRGATECLPAPELALTFEEVRVTAIDYKK